MKRFALENILECLGLHEQEYSLEIFFTVLTLAV